MAFQAPFQIAYFANFVLCESSSLSTGLIQCANKLKLLPNNGLWIFDFRYEIYFKCNSEFIRPYDLKTGDQNGKYGSCNVNVEHKLG